jgi:hypothetical protein
MNTNDYIKELEEHLSVLDKGKKDDIIKEIESYVLESEATYSLLVERFGEPKELASGYLEGEFIQEHDPNTLYKKTKRAFLTIFIFLVIVFAGIAITIYVMTRDDFNYAKYDANSVNEHLEAPWVQIKNISKLDISQTKAIIYWNNEGVSKFSCKKEDDEDDEYKAKNRRELKNDTLIIKQSACILSLPKQKFDIKTYQSKVIIVRPSDSIELNSKQSRIHIVDDGNSYNYQLNGKQSDFENFTSNPNGILIKGSFYQSKVSPYDY